MHAWCMMYALANTSTVVTYTMFQNRLKCKAKRKDGEKDTGREYTAWYSMTDEFPSFSFVSAKIHSPTYDEVST